MVQKGARSANFILPDMNGADVTLDAFRGSWTLINFFPSDFTKVCTSQAIEFRDGYAELEKRNVRLIGINFDAPEKHKRFVEQHKLPHTLLWDRQKRVARRYGVLGFLGLYCKRAYFLIDPAGWVAYAHIEKNPARRRSLAELLEVIDRQQARDIAGGKSTDEIEAAMDEED